MPDPTNFDACYAAVSSRDRRFDGRFITGVLTTGIFCRPSCPARTPKPENVRFFASAAAAANSGLRACRRCRPELAPGHPGVDPEGHLASRALRLIEAGQAESGVDELARALHISPRQLQRITVEAFGAGPAALISMRRVRLARMLVDQTDLPISRVAFQAGFGSVRQFNDAFKRTFHTTPSAVRASSTAVTGHPHVTVPARQPFDPAWVLRWTRAHAVPGRDEVTENDWTRHTDAGPITMTPTTAGVRIQMVDRDSVKTSLSRAVGLARQAFDLDADVDAMVARLGSDPVLAPLIQQHPGLRIPGAADPWEGPVRTVLGQQVSAAAASTFMGRLADLHEGPGIPPPEAIVTLPLESAIGLTRQRAIAVRNLASAVVGGLDLGPGADPLDAQITLQGMTGIGPWTAGTIALLTLRYPDAWPSGDLALRRAVQHLTGQPTSARQLDHMAQAWEPWRGYAAIQLWHHYMTEMN